jgi:uncharacterized membrane protein
MPMNKNKITAILLAGISLLSPLFVFAQIEEIPEYVPPEENFYKGQVTQILKEEIDDDIFIPAYERFSQTVEVKVLEGPEDGSLMELIYTPGSTGDAPQNLKIGEKVVLLQTENLDGEVYYIIDRYRFPSVIWLALFFLGLVILFAGWKGVRSMLGLIFSIAVILFYIIPNILDGGNPFTTFIIAGLAIALASIYLGHGFNRRTSIAVVSTLITLTLSIGLSVLAVEWTKLFGLGTEEAFYLQIGELGNINLHGLLLGGIIIGILGVLDDITTAQAATVEEIYKANPSFNVKELVKRGLSVGHEHIVSLVNTLVLAYVGASFPLLLLFSQSLNPLWITLNSERIVEEIVRTLVGSSALVIAVPITTYLAAYYFNRFGSKSTHQS